MNEEPQTILPGNASFKPEFFQLQTNFHFPFPSSHPCRLKKSTQQASLPISKKCLPLSSGSFPLSPKNAPHSLSNRHAPSVLATRSSPVALLFCLVVSPFFQIVVFFFLLLPIPSSCSRIAHLSAIFFHLQSSLAAQERLNLGVVSRRKYGEIKKKKKKTKEVFPI